MKDILAKIGEGGAIAIILIGMIAILFGFSWITTCGIIKLVTLCFGWEFSWAIATGIWLAMFLLRSIFSTKGN
jgi:hypothetical protein